MYWYLGYFVAPVYLVLFDTKDPNTILNSMFVATIGILSFIIASAFSYFVSSQTSSFFNKKILFVTAFQIVIISLIVKFYFLKLGIYSSLFIGGAESLPISIGIYNALMPLVYISNYFALPIFSWLYFSSSQKTSVLKHTFKFLLIIEVFFALLSFQRGIVIFTLLLPIFVGAIMKKIRIKFRHIFFFILFLLVFFQLNNILRSGMLALSGYKYDIQPTLQEMFIMTKFVFKDTQDSNLFIGSDEIIKPFIKRFYDNTYTNLISIIDNTRAFKLGSTYSLLFYNFIPRIFWPDKPIVQISYDFGVEYGIGSVFEKVAFTVSRIGEAYINFGIVGVILILFVWGIFATWLQKIFYYRYPWLFVYIFFNFVFIAETFFTNVFAVCFKQIVYFTLIYLLNFSLFELVKQFHSIPTSAPKSCKL